MTISSQLTVIAPSPSRSGHGFDPAIGIGEALFAALDRDDELGQIDAIKPFLEVL